MNERDIEFMKKVLTHEWMSTAEVREKIRSVEGAPLGIGNRVPHLCVKLTEANEVMRRTGPNGLSEWKLGSRTEQKQEVSTAPVWLRGLMP